MLALWWLCNKAVQERFLGPMGRKVHEICYKSPRCGLLGNLSELQLICYVSADVETPVGSVDKMLDAGPCLSEQLLKKFSHRLYFYLIIRLARQPTLHTKVFLFFIF